MEESNTSQKRGRGRPKGSKNKGFVITDEMIKDAHAILREALDNKEPWAALAVINELSIKLESKGK